MWSKKIYNQSGTTLYIGSALRYALILTLRGSNNVNIGYFRRGLKNLFQYFLFKALTPSNFLRAYAIGLYAFFNSPLINVLFCFHTVSNNTGLQSAIESNNIAIT